MICHYDWRPVSPAETSAEALLADCGPVRRDRLRKLSGRRLEESASAQRLCRELWDEFPEVPGKGVEWILEEDARGKPFPLSSELHVSLSHSGGFVSAAVSDVPVGLDIQTLRSISPGVLRRCFSPEEREWISHAGEEEGRKRAMRLWTMKEARGKLSGAGVFGRSLFCADFSSGVLLRKYGDCRFLFSSPSDELLLTVCIGYPDGSSALKA